MSRPTDAEVARVLSSHRRVLANLADDDPVEAKLRDDMVLPMCALAWTLNPDSDLGKTFVAWLEKVDGWNWVVDRRSPAP